MSLNIVELIEKSPITRLNKEYEHRFIEKIRQYFSDEEQRIFLSSFYLFLNYDSENDFVINFDMVWKWCGFTRKDVAKRLLDKFFTKNIDYIISTENIAPPIGGAINKFENLSKDIINENSFNLEINTENNFLPIGVKPLSVINNTTNIAPPIGGAINKFENLSKDVKNENSSNIEIKIENNFPPIGGKPLFLKNETENIAPPIGGKFISNINQNVRGGHNIENIFLTVNAFKKFCLKSNTKQADKIHNYYLKLEHLIQETINEETEELRKQLKIKDEVIMNTKEEYQKLQDNHNRILYKRNKHQLMRGRCLYIIKHSDIHNQFKFGISSDLNSRYSSYRTYNITEFVYIVYTEDNKLLEDCISKKFKNKLIRFDSEWICDIDLSQIIDFINSVIELLDITARKFNNLSNIIESVSDFNIDSTNTNSNNLSLETNLNNIEDQKKCNKCLIILSKNSFNKDKTKKDGLHTTCRLCEKENKKKYLAKQNELREEITEKQCKICLVTKEISNFSKHNYLKDGYVNFCHACVNENSTQKRKLDRENNIRYQCGRCGTDYTRKDVLIKHQKNCMK
jgi:hypothetical protein